jgi:hypothetical protein
VSPAHADTAPPAGEHHSPVTRSGRDGCLAQSIELSGRTLRIRDVRFVASGAQHDPDPRMPAMRLLGNVTARGRNYSRQTIGNVVLLAVTSRE